MNILQKTIGAIATFLIDKADYNTVIQAYYKGKNSGKGIDWKRQPQNMSAKGIKDWRFALMAATDPENPRRGDLMRFYQNLMTDLHLSACIENRILPVQCAPFKLVDNKGDEDVEAKKLLEKPWYIELVRLVTNHTFEGTKLIEMYDLNDKGELKEVSEIPQSNFIPTKGIVIREEYDSKGVSYKEGVYKNYYVQIGNDYNLGLLNRVAVIVIAKKLGLGSWMSYIDRFGVPPLFAITNRMDTTRRDELFEMLEAFRMNHFAVLQGDEKIEIPQGYNVDAHQTFKSLIDDVANKEISKYINGGTGTTDEKAFVGSAEVHERLLHLRNSVDKLMFKFYFNEEIMPRLVKLSPVYAQLAKLTFEWDETENLTVKEVIEAIKDLSAYYEFDIEELVRMTGLPFTELKRMGLMLPGSMSQGTDEQKKKNEASVIPALSQISTYLEANATKWYADVERLAKDLYHGKITPSDLDKDLVMKMYSQFSKTASNSYGNGYYYDSVTHSMREHLLRFSGFKANRLLSDIDDRKAGATSEKDFVEKAKKVSNTQLGAWLTTEDLNVARSAQTAKEWQEFLRDSDLYPNLKYRTMMDSDVRESHAVNEGITKPINDWDAAPPFGNKCRCWLEQTNEPPTTGRVLTHIEPAFNTNSGKNGEVFSQQHKYFDVGKTTTRDVKTKVERLKEFAPINRVEKIGKNTISISDFADLNDLEENLVAARKLVKKLSVNVAIRHFSDINGYKNPDYLISNELGDLKTYNNKSKTLTSFFKNSVESCNKQGAKCVVLDITDVSDADNSSIEDFEQRAPGIINNRYRNVQKFIFISGEEVSIITRDEILDRDFSKLRDTLL